MAYALYRFYGDAGALLYVGITDNPHRRFGQHGKGKEWWELVRGISIDWYTTRPAVEAAERRAVSVEQPIYNKALRRRVVALPKPAPDPEPEREWYEWDASETSFLEAFEGMWTARWWDDDSAVDTTGSRYRHDGRLYAWLPDDSEAQLLTLRRRGVTLDAIAKAMNVAFCWNGRDAVWNDFLRMCGVEELV